MSDKVTSSTLLHRGPKSVLRFRPRQSCDMADPLSLPMPFFGSFVSLAAWWALQKPGLLRVQLRYGQQKHVLSLEPTLPFSGLQKLVREKTGLVEKKQALSSGFPPVLLAASDSTAVSTLLKSGDQIVVQDVASLEVRFAV